MFYKLRKIHGTNLHSLKISQLIELIPFCLQQEVQRYCELFVADFLELGETKMF